jgi:hypothetical protein
MNERLKLVGERMTAQFAVARFEKATASIQGNLVNISIGRGVAIA